jgi:hypothetical protein
MAEARTQAPGTVDLPMQVRTGSVRADSIDVEARTVDLVWSTGAEVLRQDWWTGKRYKESLSLDPAHVRMDRLNSGAPVLDTHDTYSLAAVIGVVQSATVDGSEGRATVRFARTPEVDPIWAKVEQGIVRNVSVGYRVHTYEKIESDDGPDTWRATDWEPMELSFVPVGADAGAGVRSENAKTFPCIIRALPEPAHSEETLMSDAVSGNPPAEERTDEGTKPAPVVVETRTEQPAKASFKEVTAAVRSVGLDTEFRDALFGKVEDKGLTMEQARAAIFDHLAEKDEQVRTDSHITITKDERDTTRSLVENALMHRADPAGVKLEDGARQFMGLRLLELGSEIARRDGIDTRGMSLVERAGNVLGLNTRSGGLHTTSDFPYILANVANKSLRMGYEQAPRTFLPFCRRVNLPDFKQASRVQLGEAPALNEVSENGEFTYGTIGEGREVYQLATYGRIVAISRQAIINDDLGAFTRVPQLMGNAAANLESNTVYTILTGNPTMGDSELLFSTAHANFQGTGSAPDVSTIGAAMTAIGSQTGLDASTYLNLQGRYLIGGWLTHTLRAQYTSPNFQPTAQSGVNPYTGLIPITDARITDTSWYVSADPSQIDTIEYAFLDGQDGVYTETRIGFEVDGVEIKARHDFAAKAVDYRGLYRNDGSGN